MDPKKAFIIRIGVFAAIAIIAIYVGYLTILAGRELPIYSPSELNPDLVDSTLQDVSSGHTVGDFSFVNQQGDTVTRNDFQGHVTVVNFFFTTCQGICPEMNSNVHQVYQEYKGNKEVKFLSHTVDPSYDSVEVLNDYAKDFGVKGDQWNFVTGEKEELYNMARKGYFAVTSKGEGDESDFIHTENVILVDRKGRLRGFYDGTSKKQMDQLIEDIGILMDNE